MLKDIVIDTNIFMHADNRGEKRQGACKKFLAALKGCDTCLCVDEGYDPEEAKNRSQIAGEYLAHFAPGGIGFAILAYLAASSRVLMVTKHVPAAVGQKIRQAIHDPTDRVFVKVAFNSADKMLASHDEANFPGEAKRSLEKGIGIRVLLAQQACDELS